MPRFAVIILFFSHSLYGQSDQNTLISQYKDSLNTDGGRKGLWYQELGKLYLTSGYYDSAAKYYKKAAAMPAAQSDPVRLAYLYNNLGVAFYPAHPDSALHYYTRAKELFTAQDSLLQAASCGVNLGIIYKDLGLYERAVENLTEAALILEKQDKGRQLASCYNAIASIYSRQGDYSQALTYHRQALRIRQSLQIDKLIAASHNNIGIIFKKMGEYDSALHYYQKSLTIKRKLHDKKGIGVTLNNIGTVLMDQRKHDSAKPFLTESLQLRKETGDQQGIAITTNNLALLYYHQNQYSKALKLADEAHSLIRPLGLLEELRDNLEARVKILEALGKPEAALDAAKTLILVKDSLLNKQKAESLMEMQVKYETEKKIREIAMLEQKQKLQEVQLEVRQLVILGLIIVAALLIILGLVIRSKWKKEKSSKKQVETLMQELHHRVKNNLQLLSDIFSLQARNINDSDALEAVKSGENRVNAMAIIHQKLYRKSESRSVNLKEYLTSLVEELADTYGYDLSTHNIKVNIADLEMDVDRVIPLGLIVNEVVSNAFKYAFPVTANPSLTVEVVRNGNNLLLRVADNGKGFDRDQPAGTSMGLDIITTLSRQLRAKTGWETEGHVEFNLQLALNK